MKKVFIFAVASLLVCSVTSVQSVCGADKKSCVAAKSCGASSAGAVELMIDGNRYVGEVVDGLPHGKGTIYYSADDKFNRKYYKGEWNEGHICGKGEVVWNNGERYIGSFENDHKEGFGTYYYLSGMRYVGNWHNGKRSGRGTMYYAKEDKWNRKCYDGYWEEGTLLRKYKTYYLKGDWKSSERSMVGVTNKNGVEY